MQHLLSCIYFFWMRHAILWNAGFFSWERCPSQLVFKAVITHQIMNKMLFFIPKFKSLEFISYFYCYLESCYSNLSKASKENNTKNNVWIVSFNIHDLMLMLERPLSHYWNIFHLIIIIVSSSFSFLSISNTICFHLFHYSLYNLLCYHI